MTRNNIYSRLDALESALQSPRIPRSFCVMRDGNHLEFDGLTILEPFLDGKIVSLVCNDADIARLLRAMDAERITEIELVCMDGVNIIREKI